MYLRHGVATVNNFFEKSANDKVDSEKSAVYYIYTGAKDRRHDDEYQVRKSEKSAIYTLYTGNGEASRCLRIWPQHATTRCITLQHTATHCEKSSHVGNSMAIDRKRGIR